MRIALSFTLLLLISTFAYSQTRKIDSVRQRIYHSPDEGTLKKNLLYALTLQRSMNQDTLVAYIKRASALQTLSPAEVMKIDVARVYYYIRTGKSDSSLNIVERNLIELKRRRQDIELLTFYEFLHAGLLLRKNQHQPALNEYFEVLKLSERSKDINFQMRALNGIGWVYMEMSQYAEGIKWFSQALSVSSDKVYEDNYAAIYNNMAACYGALNNIDSASYCIDKCLYFAIKNEDLSSQANAFMVKANVLQTRDQIKESIAMMIRALEIRKVLNDPFYILSDLCILSNTYSAINQTDKGLAYANEALAMARKYNMLAKLPMIFISLESNYLQRKDYQKLADIYRQHLSVKDSVYHLALADELAEKEARYETDKKGREIARQKLVIQHERDTRKVMLFSLTGAIVLLGAGSLLFMQRSKALRQRKVFKSILEAEQKERIRIARDLHDSIGQMLSVVKMNVSSIHYQAGPEDKLNTESTLGIVDKTIQEVRNISHNLIPEELNFGIVNALGEMCVKVNDAGETRVILEVDDEISKFEFNKQFELSLYRIVQEIIGNMLKHAEASTISITMKARANTILLSVHDDGVGFDTSLIRESKGLGWKNIIARVNLLNGKMNIQSERIRGTQIEIIIPG